MNSRKTKATVLTLMMPITVVVGMALVDAASIAPCVAQSSYSEGFDNVGPVSGGQHGPSNLIASGWIFRNQSQPLGSGTWTGNSSQPQSGAGSLTVNATVAGSWTASAAASSWAILPAVPNQVNGDVMRFFIRQANVPCCTPQARLEVRYSPGGGTSTGLGASGVGSFTTVLLDIPDVENRPWTEQSVTLPGNGRIAFRFVLTAQSSSTSFAGDVTLDALTVSEPVAGPYPLPQSGQTVNWTTSMNPILIQGGTVLIPPDGTVVVQPGVHVQVMTNSSLRVEGTLRIDGSVSSPVTIDAISVFPPMIEVEGGTLQMAFTRIGGQVRPLANGVLLISDTIFNGPNGVIFADLYSGTGFGRFERVTFNDSELTITNYTLVLKDLTLNNSTSRFIRDYPFMTNITAVGKGIGVDAAQQGTRLDTISVRDVTSPAGGQGDTTGYGLGLTDGNFLIGPGVTLTNNTYPVQISSAGILPGSVLPATGNINNLIYVPGGDHGGPSTIWADAGLPYFLPDFYAQHGGSLKLLEGVRVKIAADVGMDAHSSPVAAYGTEERPVTFEQVSPGAHWGTLANFYRFRHAVIDGATVGAYWPSDIGWGFMDSSIVRQCSDLGAFDAGIIKKTLFQNNATAASVLFNQIDLSGDTNPNAFEGNGVGVTVAGNARNNWWGSPSGPTAPGNSHGTGDSASAGVPYQPFRTTRPDFSDAPPIVDLEQHSFLARPGKTFVLSWKARDDGSIVSQRVLMSKDGDIVQSNLDEPVIVLADGLPSTQHSIAFTMPEPVSRFFGSGNIRVEATDNAGQIGWDDLHIYAEADEPGKLDLTSPLPTEVIAGSELGAVCWQALDINPIGGEVDAYVLLENSGEYKNISGVTTYNTCLSGTLTAPFVSTDRARIVLSLYTGAGVAQPEYFFGPVFSIRPDARVDDAPPMVAITSPPPGSVVAGGGTLPIRWSASDDDAVQAIHLQISTDEGRTWNFIARDLPGSSHTYDWRLPPSTGAYGLRIKVVAVDKSFQDTSSESDILVTVVSPAPGETSATGHMTARRGAGTSILIGYTPACGAANHAIYWGTGAISGSPAWSASACGLGTTGSTVFDPGNPPPGGLIYYVIVGQNGSSEGSYGASSSGAQRAEAVGVGACDRPQAYAGCGP